MNPPQLPQGLDSGRITALIAEILRPVRDNYLKGPTSQDRALEALNALAGAAATIIAGCDGMGGHAEKFFYQALSVNLKYYCGRGIAASENGGEIEHPTE